MENMGLMHLENIQWSVKGKKKILDQIDLKVDKGDFVCIMGPTGCGKSSLMKILAGLIKAEKGSYMYEGTEVKNGLPKEKLKHIGIAYQSDSLFEWLTVEKNIKQSIKILGAPKDMDIPARLEQMEDLVGLKKYKDCYPHELSGGMKQRCAFARALVHDPDVLLLDQPFGALDAITRKLLGAELLKMWHDSNKTVVMITNNVTEALMLSNKVVFLSSGPATVMEEIKVDIPYEERFANLMENELFIELSAKLNQLVRASK